MYGCIVGVYVTHGGRVCGTKCVMGLVGPRGGLDALEKGKIVCPLLGPEVVDRSVVHSGGSSLY
jgi:hypothetical protein